MTINGINYSMDDEVRRAIASFLGGESIQYRDLSWGHRQSEVFRICTEHGSIYYAKRHGSRDAFERELYAYRNWVPALGSFAPSLLGFRSDIRLILAEGLPGRSLEYSDGASGFKQAGQLLRRFHDAGAHRICYFAEAHPLRKILGILKDASEVFEDSELNFVWRKTEALASFLKGRATKMVPCHLDFQPRNLLVDDAGVVRVIDFEYSKYDLRERDLIRIYWGCEYYGVDCRDQFFEGYGLKLDDSERAILNSLSSVWAVTTVLWAKQHNDRSYEDFGRYILHEVMKS
jgi:hypothetical protein